MHKIKVTPVAVLLAISLVWVGGYLLTHAGNHPTSRNTPTDSTAVAADRLDAAPHKVVAYYFHGNVRCATCRRIESYTAQAIDSGFSADLQSGRLDWRVVNVDSSQNKHFIDDYQLYTRSVILVDLHQGQQTRWKNLDHVWRLTGNKPEFAKYVQNEVTAYLDTTR